MTMKTNRKPDGEGAAGRWWQVSLTEEQKADPRAAIGSRLYIVDQPGVNIFWSEYGLFLIDLVTEIEGVDPAKKRFPEATHELIIFALNPDRAHDPDDFDPNNHLTPPNLVHQFKATQRDAERIMHLLCRSFVEGRLSPDSDFTRRNIEVIDATAKHFAAGAHPEN